MKVLRVFIVQICIDGVTEIREAEAVFTPGKDGVELGDLYVLDAGVSLCGAYAGVVLLLAERGWGDAGEEGFIVGFVA